jgi:diadenosine tetraphosphate (Ap4A) HIT family hydrolase
MKTMIHERVEAARAGTNPTVVCQAPSGWVVLGDDQTLPGYTLLLPDPVVPDLNALDGAARARYLTDMVTIGDALLEVTDAFRINYEILGNLEPALHAHIFPRYLSEPEKLRGGPAWLYSDSGVAPQPFDADRDADLMRKLAESLRRRLY